MNREEIMRAFPDPRDVTDNVPYSWYEELREAHIAVWQAYSELARCIEAAITVLKGKGLI